MNICLSFENTVFLHNIENGAQLLLCSVYLWDYRVIRKAIAFRIMTMSF